LFRQKINKDSKIDTYEEDFCMEIVYVSSELGEKIEDIMHWSIIKFNIVRVLINKINKLKYDTPANGPTGIKTLR